MLEFGVPFANVKYENDWQPSLLRKISPSFMPVQDGGDRYRTAALKIQSGPFSLGFNIFTGDPGLEDKNRPRGSVDNHKTYTDPNADKNRAGIFYIGFGPLKIGINSGGVRQIIQNQFAHSYIGKGLPWFKQTEAESDTEPFFEFGSGTSTLW